MTDLTNWAPFDILAGPADVYVAATGTAFPVVNVAPSGSWTPIGKTEGGVTVRHTQTLSPIGSDQTTGPVKAIRSEEGLEVEFSIVELTLEKYSIALNGVTVTSASTPSRKTINLHKGVRVDLRAILIKGRSPYGNFPAQYEIPVAYQSESPEVSFIKDDKSVLSCVWNVLEDLSAATDDDRYGRLVAQTA